MNHFHVAIIGAGFSGLGMAVRLKRAGIDDFVVLERADDIGGTWRANTYPGCQCDVESNLYSFSFAPNPGWSRLFPLQEEIWEYLRRATDRNRLRPHLRLGHELRHAEWDEAHTRWSIATSAGDLTADFLVVASGPLSEPSMPAIPGLETFPGRCFHSGAWDHSVDLRGRRVGVVGTGASGVQLVPRIQPLVVKLAVFQRTPGWILPHRDRPVRPLARRLYRALPGLQRLVRAFVYWWRESLVIGLLRPRTAGPAEMLARRHLVKQVPDPELRARLTPDFQIGCKRILLSNDYYPALKQPNVEVVTEAVARIEGSAVVGSGGTRQELDVLIFATGFLPTDPPIAGAVRGRDGRSLAEHWDGSPSAYRGTAVAGFPNLFLLLGPNTGLGHTSVVLMVEWQIDHVLDCLRRLRRSGRGVIDVLPEAQAAYNRFLDEKLRGTVWNAGGCRSWYLDRRGRNSTIWPGSTWAFRRLVRRFDPTAYSMT